MQLCGDLKERMMRGCNLVQGTTVENVVLIQFAQTNSLIVVNVCNDVMLHKTKVNLEII